MGALSRFIAHVYTLFLLFFTVLLLELVILFRSIAGTIGYSATADDNHPITTAQYLKLIDEKNPCARHKSTGLEPKECSVCLSIIEDGDEIRRLKCRHTFHKGCVDKWLEQDRATCPICRRLVLPEAIMARYSQRRQIDPHRRRRELNGGSDEELILLLTSLHGLIRSDTCLCLGVDAFSCLQMSGNDLDSAIKSLNELSLGYVNGVTSSPARSNTTIDKGQVLSDVASKNSLKNGAEWVELFVTEMTSATSIDDASVRAMRVLESLEKSINERAAGDAAETLHKASTLPYPILLLPYLIWFLYNEFRENIVFKEQIEVLLRENAILKRAVAIQHECQKKYDERNVEVQQLNQLLSQYQEQLRTLDVNP